MVQLKTHNIALALYGVLLVLPTAVLGGLQWYEIVQGHQMAKAAVPRKADDAARRLHEMVAERVNRMVADEEDRPVTHYAPNVLQLDAAEEQLTLLPSPLITEPAPQGVLAWFVFDQLDGPDAAVDLFWGAEPNAAAREDAELELHALVGSQVARMFADRDPSPFLSATSWKSYGDWAGPGDEFLVPLAALAVAHGREADYDACADRARIATRDSLIPINVTPIELHFFREDEEPRLLATRRVIVRPDPALPQGGDACVERFSRGMDLIQGFVLDPRWLFDTVPVQVARSVLDPTQRLVTPNCEDCCRGLMEFHYHSEIRLVKELDLAVAFDEDEDFALMKVAVDTGHLERNFRSQAWRYFGMAGMLTLSLATGLLLLLRSVNRDLEQARRTENFVAAVTHELRTPLSAIKLHGEMLLDGWAKDESKQQEYYRRIVRETGRLSTLVERVLEKGRLTSSSITPTRMDLNDRIARLRPHLDDSATTEVPDIAYDLAAGLPEVSLTNDTLGSILVNLVENARKYAPVEAAEGDEPILVRTFLEGRGVVLEVSDRGPGIAAEEKEHVFEAFYRVGNEQTRTTKGTGLGLHLVALQADAIGAQVDVLDRPGGGTTFRVRFRTAGHAKVMG